jgi:hypothetical protein
LEFDPINLQQSADLWRLIPVSFTERITVGLATTSTLPLTMNLLTMMNHRTESAP